MLFGGGEGCVLSLFCDSVLGIPSSFVTILFYFFYLFYTIVIEGDILILKASLPYGPL